MDVIEGKFGQEVDKTSELIKKCQETLTQNVSDVIETAPNTDHYILITCDIEGNMQFHQVGHKPTLNMMLDYGKDILLHGYEEE